MPLQLTGRHMNISEVQKDYINKKVDRLRRLCTKIDELSFTLTKEKLHFVADGTFRCGTLSAQGTVTASQPLEAIDILVDKLEHNITKQKGKRTDRHLIAREKNQSKNGALIVEPDGEPEEAETAETEAEPQRATA